jgi:phosphoenolpyruvate---glycerone phosphotransferase subunit DhaL
MGRELRVEMVMMHDMISDVAAAILAEAEQLTALDQAIGDGDHGLNMRRGMEAVLADLPKLAGKTPGEMLKAVGMTLVMKVGGASGPLFGTLAMELGKFLPAAPGRTDLAAAFAQAVAAVAARGKSERGQKTMLDVLIPVSEALSAGKSARDIKAIALAAAEATIPVKATRGRASFLGDRSIGHRDPGAHSCAIIIATLCDRLQAES